MTAVIVIVLLVAVAASFFVSSSVGLGGSLVLIPALALAVGTKEGVAIGALLLGANNLVKLGLYRRVLPVRAALVVIVMTTAGALVGANLLLAVPEIMVTVGVIAAFVVAWLAQRSRFELRATTLPALLALGSGATSGFSGTSGPLKGVAVRALDLDRMHTVGAAALASTFGDLTKTAVFFEAGVLPTRWYLLVPAAVPLMLGASYAGRQVTDLIGERGYDRMFWLIMGGYTARLLV